MALDARRKLAIMNKHLLKSIAYSLIGLIIFAALIPLVAQAYDIEFYRANDIFFYNPEDTGMKSPSSNPNSSGYNPALDANKAKLAKIIIDSKKVYDGSGQLQEIADGKRTNVDRGILLVLLELIDKGYSFSISSLHREYDPDFPFSTSKHLIGRAVDIYNINGYQLVWAPPGYSETTRLTQEFILVAAPILLKYANGSCFIGQPDEKIGYKTGGLCITDWDKGTGPHVHLDLKDGTDTTISYDSSAAIKKTDVTYSVVKKGSTVDDASFESFMTTAQTTLNSPLGWAQLGITFTKIPSGGRFTLYLSEYSMMTTFNTAGSTICDEYYSCNPCKGCNKVVINFDRWRYQTNSWINAKGTWDNYQRMVINHEVGHWLDNRDLDVKKTTKIWCDDNTTPAPLMLQQSMDLRGCNPNPWPLESELNAPLLKIYLATDIKI